MPRGRRPTGSEENAHRSPWLRAGRAIISGFGGDRPICRDCNGNGLFYCDKCDEGTWRRTVDCLKCGGSGNFMISGDCRSCTGSGRYGKYACRKCGGTGRFSNSFQCKKCSGEGSVTLANTCRKCNGDYNGQCRACKGSGRWKREDYGDGEY